MNKEIILQSIENQSYILGLVFLLLILCAVLDKRVAKENKIFVKIGIGLIGIAILLVININLLLIELL